MYKKIIIVIMAISITMLLLSCQKTVYKVTFFTYSDDSIETTEYNKTINYNHTHIPNKTGHEFKGWYLEAALIHDYKPNIYENKNMELHAKWQESQTAVPDMIALYETSYENHKNAKQSYYVAEGETKTDTIIGKVTQTIYSVKHVQDDMYYQFTASVGMAKMFFESYGTASQLEVISGEVNQNFEVTKIKKTEQKSDAEYQQMYGVFPNELNYIVSKDTVITAYKYAKNEGIHQFELILDLEKSVPNYIKNIKATNQYESKDAIFKQIILIVRITESGYFEKIMYKEQYEVSVNIPIIGWQKQLMNASITETFSYNIPKEIIRKTEDKK